MNNYKGPMTTAEYVMALQQERKEDLLREQVIKANKDREAKNKTMFEQVLDIHTEGAQRRDSFLNFSYDVKEALLTECLTRVYEGAVGYKYQSTVADSVKKSLISKFIQEQGVDRLVSSFKTRSLMLSEFASLINKYHKLITEACDKQDPATFTIDHEFKTKFFEELDNTDADAVAEVIKSRVTTAIEEFITANMANKMEIKDIMDDSQNRIESIKTIKDDEKRAQQEAWIRESAQIKIDAVRNNKPKSVFSTMVENMSVACMKDPALKEQFTTEEGKLDIDSIVESCEMMYTLLEMVNTTKMVNVDAAYVERFIEGFK